MKIAIIEDELSHQDLLCAYVQGWGDERKEIVKIWGFKNAEQFLFEWEENLDFEVLFVDIQMPGINGMELARKIREKDEKAVLIFTTGIADYLEAGYEVAALRYLRKPLRKEKVWECLDMAVKKHIPESFLLVNTEEEVKKLAIETINYVEAVGHKSGIGLAGGGYILAKEGISELERDLGKDFIKCHRSYLCRIENIRQIRKDAIIFDDGSEIPVSRRMYPEVNRAFIEHYSRLGNRNIVE